ncbi:protein-glutamate methylesterase/protein-glutamine glutaminase [Methanosalsum natronophilum]|uniref:Protein-glutamate methylesterase/protein-glutamine glutaminase n=1 Tax=Methanosalsum natronophilum TaxID=768733 RepID=A0A3R7XUN1_9EURY|nr:chemotaxis response regulator protein-glutamate methylesterase [Methanosalsum natronophilum]MCS3922978.1 two-component system chemotaxis response regulator CheB [Methanosalsum natronophilum]RQD85341.1 MAG: chemotaxis response regulator protein-glutamate methylesterase [Methanosalsum natronophilum]
MTIKAIVVDDSAFMRKVISDILDNDSEIDVIATARNGKDAIEKIERYRPDVVTLDIEMPVLNGLEALGYIMSECPTPVVMLSSLDEKGAETTLTAFEYGAVDFVHKTSGSISLDISSLANEICSKVKIAASVDVKKLNFMEEHVCKNIQQNSQKTVVKGIPVEKKVQVIEKAHINKKILAIGSSTGGPRALEKIIPNLPKNFPAAVLVVQHMPASFTASFSKRLDLHSNLKVKEAEEGDIVKEGLVLIAPGDFHMEVIEEKIKGKLEGVIRLNKNPKEKGVRPAVNVLFRSIAPIYGSNILSLVLTGMGSDGLDGVNEIKRMGGITYAEHKETCVVYGMPKVIVDNNLAEKVIPLDKIPYEVIEFYKNMT